MRLLLSIHIVLQSLTNLIKCIHVKMKNNMFTLLLYWYIYLKNLNNIGDVLLCICSRYQNTKQHHHITLHYRL